MEFRNIILLLEDILKKGQKQKDALTRRESRNLWESPGKNAGAGRVRRSKDGVNFAHGVEMMESSEKSGI